MPTFSPPIEDGQAWGDTGHDSDKLMRHFGAVPTGKTVWQDQALAWHEQQYPYAGRSDNPGLAQARRVYVGGHVHDITDTQYVELVAAGYQNYLNIANTEMVWRPEQVSKLQLSNMSFTGDGAVPATPTVGGDQKGAFTLSAGPVDTSGGRRDFWLHRDIRYQDFEIETELNNVDYGVAGRLQQGGICCRYIETGGLKYAVVVNNNVFFFVPFMNVGVWKANLDGTGFINRQYSFPVESAFSPLFPHKLAIKLTGNICQVKTWQEGKQVPPWSNDKTTYTNSKAINLDTDAGSPAEVANIPTPTGYGGAGFMACHLGTSAVIKYGYTKFRNQANG